MDFIYENWYWLVVLVSVPLGFYIPAIRTIMKAVLKAALTKQVLEQLVVELLEYLAKQTKSKVDDQIVLALKKKLDKDK